MAFDTGKNNRFLLILNRNNDQGIFYKRDLFFLEKLQHHIQRCCSLFISMQEKEQRSQEYSSALMNVEYPIALISSLGNVAAINQSFIDLGEKYNLFDYSVEKKQLIFRCNEYQEKFNLALLPFLTNIEHEQTKKDFLLIRSDLCNIKFNFRALGENIIKQVPVLVELKEVDKKPVFSVDEIQQVIDATLSEANVVSHMVAGEDAKDIAINLNLSIHTVRGYVKSLLAKNDCRKQSDLIALIINHLS
jgi:DNA-binding CsgD family transcriptional regulator